MDEGLGRPGSLHLGALPPDDRAASATTTTATVRLWRFAAGLPLLHRLLVCAELVLVPSVVNCAWWRRVCIPSSNALMNARALAALYGALANGGEADGRRVYSAGFVARLLETVERSPTVDGGRMTLGWRPWLDGVCGCSPRVLGHTGLGGAVAFSDADRSLAIVVLRNGYTPVSATGSQVCDTTREIVACIEDHLDGRGTSESVKSHGDQPPSASSSVV